MNDYLKEMSKKIESGQYELVSVSYSVDENELNYTYSLKPTHKFTRLNKLRDELKELDERTKKLDAFSSTKEYHTLPKNERTAMLDQYNGMMKYGNALRARILIIKEKCLGDCSKSVDNNECSGHIDETGGCKW